MQIASRLVGIFLLLVCLLYPAAGGAVILGQMDVFQDGTTQGWSIGATIPSPAQPVIVPDGGPAGAGDQYMLLTALGTTSPNFGSRLSVFNEAQWTGDYLAAKVNTVTMSVKNLGATDLSLRLVLARFPVDGFPADLMAMTTVPVSVPAGSDWTTVVFSLDPHRLTALVGTVQEALTAAGELRIVHNPTLSWPPPKIEASLGVDNIKAARTVALGQIDDFQDSTTQNWSIGATIPSPAQPVVEPDGGPAGAGDHYLRLTALGTTSPNFGSRLSVFNEVQWSGNYLAAGVNAVSMWVNNLGTTDLSLRLVLANFPVDGFPADLMAMSTVPVFVPAGSGWTPVVFPLDPSRLTALVGTVQQALTQPGELRLVHNPSLSWPPPRLEASLGVDNIKAEHLGALPYLPLLLLDN